MGFENYGEEMGFENYGEVSYFTHAFKSRRESFSGN